MQRSIVGADELAQRRDRRPDRAADLRYELAVDALLVGVPVPDVVKGGDLRLGFAAALVLEEDIVRAVWS